MIVEVVAVGTELLLGQIVNGNAATIGAALAENGFDANHQQVVGDNLVRMADVLSTAMARADAVIVTGGIGPTQDDITREALCLATGLEMDRSEPYERELRERFERSGRTMPVSNLRQAEHPRGAELLPNPRGSAPGLFLDHEGKYVFVLPGVPEEMALLLTDHVMPRLRTLAGFDEVLVSRVLRTWGSSESQVAELLDDLYNGTTNPSVAFLASAGEIKVRLTAKADTAPQAQLLIEPLEAEVRNRLGSTVFGVDSDTIETVLFGLLRERHWSIGTAESVTGGAVSTRLTAVPGASAVYRGSVVAYATDLKVSLLGLQGMEGRVVSEPAAIALADGARALLGVDVAVSLTGSAGPDPQEQPPGTVVIAVGTPEKTAARTMRFPGDRERVRAYASTAALQLARLAVTGQWWTGS